MANVLIPQNTNEFRRNLQTLRASEGTQRRGREIFTEHMEIKQKEGKKSTERPRS